MFLVGGALRDSPGDFLIKNLFGWGACQVGGIAGVVHISSMSLVLAIGSKRVKSTLTPIPVEADCDALGPPGREAPGTTFETFSDFGPKGLNDPCKCSTISHPTSLISYSSFCLVAALLLALLHDPQGVIHNHARHQVQHYIYAQSLEEHEEDPDHASQAQTRCWGLRRGDAIKQGKEEEKQDKNDGHNWQFFARHFKQNWIFCENFCLLQGWFGASGPKVAKKSPKWVPGTSPPRGPQKFQTESKKRVKIVGK